MEYLGVLPVTLVIRNDLHRAISPTAQNIIVCARVRVCVNV